MTPLALILDLTFRLILPGLAVSALVLGLCVRRRGERGEDPGAEPAGVRGHFALALAVAAGLISANWLREPIPYLPEETGWPAILPVSLAALLLGAALAAFVSSRAAGIALALAVASVLGGLLVPAELRSPVWLAGVILAGVVNYLILSETSGKSAHGLVPLAWAGWCLGAALVLLVSHSARLAEGALLFTAALSGIACVAVARPFPSRAAALAIGLVLPCLMLAGFDGTFSSVPWISFALVAFAPLTLPLSWFARVHGWPERRQALLQMALLATPVVVALALAIHAEGV